MILKSSVEWPVASHWALFIELIYIGKSVTQVDARDAGASEKCCPDYMLDRFVRSCAES